MVSRRDFLKGSAVAGAAVPFALALGGSATTVLAKQNGLNVVASPRVVDATCAEIYEIQSSYQRMRHTNITQHRSSWDQTFKAWRKQNNDQGDALGEELSSANTPGYTTLDYALQSAAGAIGDWLGVATNNPDRGAGSWEGKADRPAKKWVQDPVEMSKNLKQAAMFLGASQVGICELDRRWVFATQMSGKDKVEKPVIFSTEHTAPVEAEDAFYIPDDFRWAVVIISECDPPLGYGSYRPHSGAGQKQASKYFPSMVQQASSSQGYTLCKINTPAIAEFIRSLGYEAIPSINDMAHSIPLAIDAGLGQVGRNQMLITPWFGPRIKVTKVLTNLPLAPDKPIDFGVTEFCDVCGKCADFCPSQAIMPVSQGRTFEPTYTNQHTDDPSRRFQNPGTKKWYNNTDLCNVGRSAMHCECNCNSVCPFNKGPEWWHELARLAIAKVPSLDAAILALDDSMGYGELLTDTQLWWPGKYPG